MNPQQLTDLPARGILEDRLDRAIEVVHSRLVIGPGLDGDIAIPAPVRILAALYDRNDERSPPSKRPRDHEPSEQRDPHPLSFFSIWFTARRRSLARPPRSASTSASHS